jgi:hypothetical protein
MWVGLQSDFLRPASCIVGLKSDPQRKSFFARDTVPRYNARAYHFKSSDLRNHYAPEWTSAR